MTYFGSTWGDEDCGKAKQYIMYGILVPYNKFLGLGDNYGRLNISNNNDEIRGVFTGRNGEFIIIGKVLDGINSKSKEPIIVPELDEIDTIIIEKNIKEEYNLEGDFHYYFVKI